MRDHEVQPAISVEIRHRSASLFAVNLQSTFLPGNRPEIASTVASQQQAAPAVVARRLGLHCKKILRQHEIFVAIAIEVANANTERRRHLRLDR